MYKLSKIEVDDFRIFRGHNSLELLNNTGEPYDFICIFGINGTGKTALVDALEWLATGKLHRIDSDMQVQGKTYNGAILTHLEAYKKNQRASVKAHFMNLKGEVIDFKRNIQSRSNNINDYLSGKPSGNGLSSTQILPYSRVAGFVSAEKPEQRFASWTGFVDPENQNFSVLVNTYRLRSKINTILENKKQELKNKTAALNNCKLDDGLILILNESISAYNEVCKELFTEEKPLALLQQRESEIYSIPDLSSVKAIQLRYSSDLERLRTREPIFKQLVDNYSEYLKAKNDLISSQKTEKAYQEKIDKIQKKIDCDKILRSLNSLYDALIHQHKKCTNVISEQIKITTEQKEKLEKEHKIWRQQLEQIETKATKLKESDPNPAYQNASLKKKVLQSGLASLAQINIAVNSQNFEDISPYTSFLPHEYSQEILEKIQDLTLLNDSIQNIIAQRKQISLQIKEAESSSNEVIESIEQIRAHIANAQLKICPVCQTEFSSTDSLLARIKQEFYSKDLAKAHAEYNAKDAILKSSQESYRNMVDLWEMTRNNINVVLDKELVALNKKIEEITTNIEQYNHNATLLEAQRQIVKEQINTLVNSQGELTLDNFDLMIENAFQCLNGSLFEKEAMQTQLDSILKTLEAIIQGLPGEAADLQQLETLLHYLPNQPANIEELKTYIQEFIGKIDQLVSISVMISGLSDVNPNDLQAYQAKIDEIAQQQVQLKSIIDAYQKLLINVQLTQQISLEEINQQFSDEQKKIDAIGTKILPSLISILGHETKLLTYQREYQNLVQERDELNITVEADEKAFERINYLYNSMCSLQQETVNTAFAGEMVNELYRMLEPNKEFPRLSFDIGFNSAERPELYINAHDSESGESIVLPELIFSTAQLNTISLCIFLSSALSNSQLNSRTLIFDDPISSFDDINTVAFADLLRILCTKNKWQIVFTTHDEKLFRLLQVKLSPQYHNSLFLEFKDKGRLVDMSGQDAMTGDLS